MTASTTLSTPRDRTPGPRAQTTAIVTAAFGQNIVYATVSTFLLYYLSLIHI